MRIAPDELSINDIDVYNKVIYAQNTKFLKAPYYYDAFKMKEGHVSVFSETNNVLHSQEKRLMSHAFSRANILGLQDSIYSTINEWMAHVRSFIQQDKPIPLWNATQCLALENTSLFSYGSSDGAMDTANFNHDLIDMIHLSEKFIVVFQQFPFIRHLFKIIGRWEPSGANKLFKVSSRAIPTTLSDFFWHIYFAC